MRSTGGKYMIKWNERYKLGIDIIDMQHKKLFDLAEEAEVILEQPDYIDKFDNIVSLLDELRDYIKYHFSQEEEILLKIGYKKFFAHKVEHTDFIESIYGLDLGDIDRNQNEHALTLLNTLMNWLIEHVLVQDKEWSTVYHEFYKVSE